MFLSSIIILFLKCGSHNGEQMVFVFRKYLLDNYTNSFGIELIPYKAVRKVHSRSFELGELVTFTASEAQAKGKRYDNTR